MKLHESDAGVVFGYRVADVPERCSDTVLPYIYIVIRETAGAHCTLHSAHALKADKTAGIVTDIVNSSPIAAPLHNLPMTGWPAVFMH